MGTQSVSLSGPSSLVFSADPIGSGQLKNCAPVMACVRRIVDRAVGIGFETDEATAALLDNPSYRSTQSGVDFWRQAFEGYLLDGGVALLLQASGKLLVATQPTILDDGEGDAVIQGAVVMNHVTATASVRADKGEVVRWLQEHNSTRQYNPTKLLTVAAKLYSGVEEQGYKYAASAEMVSGFLSVTGHQQDPDKLQQLLTEMNNLMGASGLYQWPVMPHGVEFKRLGAGTAPLVRDLQNAATVAIGRVYGVPIQLLQLSTEGVRVGVEELDTHMWRDAVSPLLQNFASSLSRLLKKKVKPNAKAAALPTRSAIGGAAMQLAQSGVYTINEVRALLGDPPMPGTQGDALPQTAGAAERGGASASNTDDDMV